MMAAIGIGRVLDSGATCGADRPGDHDARAVGDADCPAARLPESAIAKGRGCQRAQLPKIATARERDGQNGATAKGATAKERELLDA